MQQTNSLPQNERVEVEFFERSKQPVGQAGILFSRFCIDVGHNYILFPIDPLEWRKIDDNLKNYAWEQVVKVNLYIIIYVYFLYIIFLTLLFMYIFVIDIFTFFFRKSFGLLMT